MIKKILFSLGLLSTLCFSPHSASAAVQLPDYMRPSNLPDFNMVEATDPDHPETAATQSLILFVGKILSQVLLFMGSVAVIFLIIAGANYILAFGKDDKIERGKRGIFWSSFGLIIILLSYAIVQGIIQILLQVDSAAG